MILDYYQKLCPNEPAWVHKQLADENCRLDKLLASMTEMRDRAITEKNVLVHDLERRLAEVQWQSDRNHAQAVADRQELLVAQEKLKSLREWANATVENCSVFSEPSI